MFAIVIGFPVALIIAWAFELTPEGLKRTEDVDLAKQSRRKSRAWIYIVIVGALLSVGLFMLGRYGFREKISASRELPAKSIAVLPFVNMSADKNDEYLSDGMTEELLDVLTKVPACTCQGEQFVLRSKGKTRRTSSAKSAISFTWARCWKAVCAKPATSCALPLSSSTWRWLSSAGPKDYDGDVKDILTVQSDVAETSGAGIASEARCSEATRV